MRLCIIALGTRGDVQPCVALARGLQLAGHDVCVASERFFEPLIRSRGLRYSPVCGNAHTALQSDSMRTLLEGKRTSFFARLFARYSPPDLPLTRGFRPHPHLDRLTHAMFVQLTWSFFRSSMNRARREVLGLPPLPAFKPHADLERKPWPRLCAYSAHVSPRPQAAAGDCHVTGYWFQDEAPSWQPPRALTDFLASGAPPVYVGFGSMARRSPQTTTELVVNALARAGQRGILATGWGGLTGAARSDQILLVDDVPHEWVFPRVAAVVHHGGSGTTAAGLRAGRPTVILPFGLPDQPYWGDRVRALGAGPPPIQHKHLSVETLADTIRIAVGNREMRRRAEALGERIRAEDGVARAVEVLETSICPRGQTVSI
ncbi:MAG: glycosyltransferase [Acidobacteria bacterium]|nr:MAG: glycosyltransferase [Acidobacteriota bacterium]